MSTAHLARLRARLEREVEAGRLPGAVVAIARRGRLVFYEALGFLDPAARTPMRKDAIFSIASMTKPLTAVATLLLMEEGRLHLAEPAARYLPMLARARVVVDAANPAATVPLRVPISIHDLLRHTAGMTYAWEGSSATHKLWPGTPSQFARELDGTSFLEAVARWPLLHQPASVWEYGVATDVAGLLVEAVAGAAARQVPGRTAFHQARHARHELRGASFGPPSLRAVSRRGPHQRSTVDRHRFDAAPSLRLRRRLRGLDRR